jgi:outer membrane protein assembly complex protein YaeT
MDTNGLTSRIIAASLVVLVPLLAPSALPAQVMADHGTAEARAAVIDLTAVITEVAFVGLRRISSESLRNKINSHRGIALDQQNVERDVRTLARTGWFETVRADVEPAANPSENSPGTKPGLRLTFYVPELPFLTKLEYGGSRLLSQVQIKKLLKEKNLEPKLGSPENPVALDAACRAIESVLAEMAHPRGQAKIIREESSQATVQIKLEITDGPHVPVGRILFAGSPAVSQRKLKSQMRRLSPASFLAGVRGTNAYTREAFEEDREHLLAYYQNHGYQDARIGTAQISEYEAASRTWIPWPPKARKNYLAVTIPIEAGTFYRTSSVVTSAPLERAVGLSQARGLAPAKITAKPFYSAQDTENLRRVWEARVHAWAKRENAVAMRDVEVIRTLDASANSARITLDLSPEESYTVRRLEFRGIHRFPDRYFRRRIGVKEGEPLDERALEAGLRRLARTGYFKPIKREDVQVLPNHAARTLNVTIHVEELGLQRVSMVGGRGQFGNTLGIAYSLFNILDREELLTSKIEGGPEALELALRFAKEGFLGSRGSLALSVFNTFLRPRLTGSVKGPFYKQSTKGVSADWTYELSGTNTFSANYSLSYSLTSYSPVVSTGLIGSPGLATSDAGTESSSRAVGAGWTHDAGNERIVFANSVSGGLLGGTENVVRSKFEFGRILRDPFFGRGNAWAFRATFSGAGSYSGDMPLTARLFAGDAYVRGLRDGELGPSAVVSSTSSKGATVYSATPAGANLISAVNAEYRIPLSSSIEAAGFFDLGSGWLLPNWLGPLRPWLIDSTGGVIHGSTGVELRWTLPGIGVPLRGYYALNVLRLNRPVWMPNASLFRVHNRFAAFGWGLGSLF